MYGIDTLHLKFWNIPFNPTTPPWIKVEEPRPDGSINEIYSLYIPQYQIKLVYYPISSRKSQEPLLIIHIASVQFLRYGHNSRFLPTIDLVIRTIETVLSLIPEVSFLNLDVSQAEIDQIDIAEDYFVGDLMKPIFELLWQREYPYRSKSYFQNRPIKFNETNGIVFWTNENRTTIYDKGFQSGRQEDIGKIRLEARIASEDLLYKFFGNSSPKLAGITNDQLEHVIQNDLSILGLDKTTELVGNDTTPFFKIFHGIMGLKLLGYGVTKLANPLLTRRELARKLGMSEISLRKLEKQYLNSGLIKTSGTSTVILPLESYK